MFVAATLALGAWAGAQPEGHDHPVKEYELKAVLLYNFTKFVEWPESSFSNPEAPLVIGILGRDPFGKTLDNAVRTETYNNRRIVVEHYLNVAEARNCHILFVATSVRDELPRILANLRGRPILTVGESEGFSRSGGMIRFWRSSEGKIQLRIHLTSVRKSGLSISAKLLRVAEVISDPI